MSPKVGNISDEAAARPVDPCAWIRVCTEKEIPARGGRRATIGELDIAVFRASHGAVVAIENKCPHRGGLLSEGIMSDHYVTCPMHGWKIDILTGTATSPDKGCLRRFPVDLRDGEVFVNPSGEAYRESTEPIEDVTGVHADSKRPILGRKRAEAPDFFVHDFEPPMPVLSVEPPSPDTTASLKLTIDWGEEAKEFSIQDLCDEFEVIDYPTHLTCMMFGFSKKVQWTGIRLMDVLNKLDAPARFFASFYSWDTDQTPEKDRFFETLKRDYCMDPRTLLVLGMDGAPLPKEHGGPLRLAVPFLQGYKSVKWLTSIKFSDEDEVGYKKKHGFIEFPELQPPEGWTPPW